MDVYSDGSGTTTEFEYDDNNLLIFKSKQTESMVFTKELRYREGHLDREVYRGSGSNSSYHSEIRYEYDADGRLISKDKTWSSELNDSKFGGRSQQTLAYTNTGLSRLIVEDTNDAPDVSNFAYDEEGRMKQIDAPKGNRYYLRYNEGGYVEEIELTNERGNSARMHIKYTERELIGCTFTLDVPAGELIEFTGGLRLEPPQVGIEF